jgi:hypothetical protein
MEVEASDPASLLSLRILEGHGLQGRPVSETVVGQRLTMEVLLKNTCINSLIFQFFPHF